MGPFYAGDLVEAVSPVDNKWYPGIIKSKIEEGLYEVEWDDPDEDEDKVSEIRAEVRLMERCKVDKFVPFKVKDIIKARFPKDGEMYPATCIRQEEEGYWFVKWEEAFEGIAESRVREKDMRMKKRWFPPPPKPATASKAGSKAKTR